MRAREISRALRKAMLQNGSMDAELYQDKLSDQIGEWHEEILEDRNSCVFVIAERDERVAMVMIDREKNIWVNEEAREKLAQLWKKNYVNNMKMFIPDMADRIDAYGLAVNGVTVVKTSKRAKAIGMGKKST